MSPVIADRDTLPSEYRWGLHDEIDIDSDDHEIHDSDCVDNEENVSCVIEDDLLLICLVC